MRESKASSAYSFIGRSTRGKKNGDVTRLLIAPLMTFTAVALFVAPAQTSQTTTQQTDAPTVGDLMPGMTVSAEKIVEEPEVEISTNGKIVGPAPR